MKTRNYYLLIFAATIAIAAFSANKAQLNKKTGSISTGGAQFSNQLRNVLSQDDAQPALFDPDLLLPDLQVAPLAEAYIVFGPGRARTLRFPGTFINRGDGPLEFIGVPDDQTHTVNAIQHIYKKDGSREEKHVGNFFFLDSHSHWHFENFVEFELYGLKNNDELDQKLVGTGKMTFCVHDFAPLAETLPGKPTEPAYPLCVSELQGISVGWADTYVADIEGQELDITDLADGIYGFRSIADPDNRILEKNEDNNVSVSYLEIAGNRVRVIPAP